MNKIDVDKTQNEMLNLISEQNKISTIEDYINNYELKTSLVNIDSMYRNKIPQNIVEMNNVILPTDPLETKQYEQLIKLNIINHPYIVGDKIIVQNVKANKIILNNSISLLNNFDYYIIHMNNHGILPEYTIGNNFNINISPYEPLAINDRLISNIPINSLIGIHAIHIYSENSTFITTDIYNTLTNLLKISSSSELTNNYLFIKLPFKYTQDTLNTNMYINNIYIIEKIFEFEFTNIGGIIIPYLNANYPINYLQYQSYHEIVAIETDYVYFKSQQIAIFSQKSGGSSIIVGKMINTIEGYPDANNYTIQLKKSFTDVVRLELTTSEIPYVDFNIKNKINIQNNKLYWQYLDDGSYIYSITVPEGSYNPASLISVLKTSMNQIARIGSTVKETIYNLFDIDFNENSQEVTFLAYKFQSLPNSLTIETDSSLGNDVVKLNVKHPNNFINIGDTIIISGAKKIGDISSNLINTTHIIYSINRDTYTYTILIILDQLTPTPNYVGTGGQNIKIRVPTNVSFLFNYPNTIGFILGFKNTGQSNAITPFSYITSNFSDYIIPTPLDTVGNSNTINSLLNLSGSFYYMLLYVNDYEGIQTNSNLDNSFSKILMIGNSGDIMFNTFVNSPLEFDIPIGSINEIKIKFLYPDGSLPDFRNFDHSFTFRITERISKPKHTGLNSRKTNYIEGLKEMHLSL